MSRTEWRRFYRAYRITRRENDKAMIDMAIFGIGYTKSGDMGNWRRDGSDILRYVSFSDIWRG